MPSAAPPVRTAAGVIIPTSADGSVRQVSLVVSAALTVAAIAGLAILSLWYAPIAFLAAGAGAGYSLSGSV
jgi:hypothetical protein